MIQVTVEVCSRLFAYPDECPCCGDVPDGELAIPFKTGSRLMAEDTARRLLFPYCRKCVDHVKVWEAGSMTSALLTLFAIVGGLTFALRSGPKIGVLVFGGAIASAIVTAALIRSRARARCRPSCAAAARAITYYGWSGSTSTFAFASATYTARFAERNVTSLVSVDHKLRSLLEAHAVARVHVPTPVIASRVVPPPRTIDEWMKLLEQPQTRVARRIALSRALSMTCDEHDRATLVHVVCRAELVPFFEEIDSQPRSAKKRRLDRAIADIKADNVPEVLRDAQLRELVKRSLKLG